MSAEPRPMRADARRNRERLLDAARPAFAEHGAEASLDEIARRAGVGPGTLYRHFPSRDALLEAVCREDIATLAALAHELLETQPPDEALVRWMRAQLASVVHKRGLKSALKAAADPDAELFAWCRDTLREAADALVAAAQRAGTLRADVTGMDLLRLSHGLGVVAETAPDAADRLISLTLDGLRVRPAGASR